MLKSLRIRAGALADSNDKIRDEAASFKPLVNAGETNKPISSVMSGGSPSVRQIIIRSLAVGVVFSLISMFFLGSFWILLITFLAGVVSNVYVGIGVPSKTKWQGALKGGLAGGISGVVIFLVSILYENIVLGETAAFSLNLAIFIAVTLVAVIGGLISGFFYTGKSIV